MRLVIVESPFAAPTAEGRERNDRYLRACLRDCIERGEAPYASHGLYTKPGVLDDNDPAQREHGIRAGFAWREMADATVVYTDLGISRGMEYGIEAAKRLVPVTRFAAATEHPIEQRSLGEDWEAKSVPDPALSSLTALLSIVETIGGYMAPEQQAAVRLARLLVRGAK